MKRPSALIILDGFGYRKEKKYNAIAQAYTPTFNFLLENFAYTLLESSGAFVGLPSKFIGNSEVGHLTIGSGRIVKQPIVRINNSIDDGSFFTKKTLISALNKLMESGHTLHIMGLLSDAGVHSHEKHLCAFIKAACAAHVKRIIVHAFLDGRDTPPKSAQHYLQELQNKIDSMQKSGCNVLLGSLHGRFYAMDRDKNWERTDATIDLLNNESNAKNISWADVLRLNYGRGIYDEFIPPTWLIENSAIKKGDGIIFFNFRPDRARQLAQRLLRLPIKFLITPILYADDIKTKTLFRKSVINNTFLDILSKNNKTVFAIAETEKYAHITYFFSGGREKPYANETFTLIPSIEAKNYVNYPCMSAQEITSRIIQSLKTDPKDFYLINYANPDMVGHSGDLQATIKAIECIDQQLKLLYQQIVEKMDGVLYITSDHGNAEFMFNEKTGEPHTAHTTNPIYFIFVKKEVGKKIHLDINKLSDIAPFILEQNNIWVPWQMQK